MALLSRIYFNAVFGALGGLIGWLLYGAFGDPGAADSRQWLLGGALIGGSIGYCVVSVEAIRDRAPLRFCRLAAYGMVLGAAGGALGLWLGDQANYELLERYGGRRLEVALLARGLGWLLLGWAVGLSEGVAARSLAKLSYGAVGGALGGFLGGTLFGLLYLLPMQRGPDSAQQTALAGAVGLMLLGACIGALSALVRGVFQPASLRVLRGWQEGRDYPLDKPRTWLGRDEAADIPLFRDMRVEKRHALLRREQDRFVLENHAPGATLVNGIALEGSQELHDGDRLQLGEVVLRLQLRAARKR
ncbi:MAG: FHA domain-containing protein [Planctomycetia bacterium]|nr:FHA domain-containing protein [Planctomycetia bacterium]